MNATQVFEKRKIAVAIGIDLAKDHCDVVAYNADNKICFSKANMSYPKLMEWLANAYPAVVLMESCKGCHVRARDIADLGHDTRLVKGADVKALRNVAQKNDIRDADYIARLYYVPGTKYVFVKNQRQQSLQFQQNEYKSLQEMRIQLGNQIHAGLEEFGCPARKSSTFIQTRMMAHLEKNAELIPEAVMASFQRRREMWLTLFEQEEEAKKRMEQIADTDNDAKRIMTVPGVGAQTAVRLLVHIGGDIGRFKNSGQFAASIGLVPKQNSTGGNTTLNGITKCGPKRLRSNLVQCGQVILMHGDKLKGNLGDWVRKLRDSGKKRGVIACAIASKIARIVYRLMKDKVDYTPVPSR